MAPRSGIYSKSGYAARKKAIDQTLHSLGRPLDYEDETYIKGLMAHTSGKSPFIRPNAKGLQFFIIRGGAEGFLRPWLGSIDASRETEADGATTSTSDGVRMLFDNVDLMVVFDKQGALLAAAPLRRPLSIEITKGTKVRHIWTEGTANRVYGAWDGRPVTMYYNRYFDVAYYGLMVDDSLGMYRRGSVRIDIHKEEATNGCIFIVDDSTPPYDPDAVAPLSQFEPALIKKVQKAIGAKSRSTIGTMHMVEID